MRTTQAFHVIDAGHVKASIIWHETSSGVRFNVVFTRLCRTDDRWWDTSCFEHSDMPALARLAEEANAWISYQAERLGAVDGDEDSHGPS